MSIESLKNIAGINVQQGLTNCMDDEELYLSIADMYVEQINEYLPQLAQLFSDQSWVEYGHIAHSIKGASASFGTEIIQSKSAELEQAGKQQDSALIVNEHENYIELLTKTLEQIQNNL